MSSRIALSTDRVIDAAMALIDERGFDALSLSSLASRLEVRVPSLYKHIGGIAELRNCLAERSRGEIRERVTEAAHGVRGFDALRAVAVAYRSYAVANSARFAAAMVGGGRILQDAPLRVLFQRIVAECGVPAPLVPGAAMNARVALRWYAYLDAFDLHDVGVDPDEAFTLMLQVQTYGLRALAGTPPVD